MFWLMVTTYFKANISSFIYSDESVSTQVIYWEDNTLIPAMLLLFKTFKKLSSDLVVQLKNNYPA